MKRYFRHKHTWTHKHTNTHAHTKSQTIPSNSLSLIRGSMLLWHVQGLCSSSWETLSFSALIQPGASMQIVAIWNLLLLLKICSELLTWRELSRSFKDALKYLRTEKFIPAQKEWTSTMQYTMHLYCIYFTRRKNFLKLQKLNKLDWYQLNINLNIK